MNFMRFLYRNNARDNGQSRWRRCADSIPKASFQRIHPPPNCFQLVLLHFDLCVEFRKYKLAKEALHQVWTGGEAGVCR